MQTTDYVFHGFNLSGIRNRNEERVLERLDTVLAELHEEHLDILDIQDIYALTLNLLPSRYHQPEGITLKEPVTDEQVDHAIRTAIRTVHEHPSY